MITAPGQLELGLRSAIERHDSEFRPIQETSFAERFDLTEMPSSHRAAEAIRAFVGGETRTANELSRAA